MLFPREMGLRRRPCETREKFDEYVNNLNGKASIYTSLYGFERRHPTKAWKYDPESVVIDRAWWDFDTTPVHDIKQVKKDVATLLSKLNGDVRVVATGRGFHVHEIFEKPVKGQAIARHILRYQTQKAKGLPTLDGVGNPQKLTRVPDTFNVTRGKWAVNIDVDKFITNPLTYIIPKEPKKELRKHDPFRGEKRPSNFNIVRWIADNPALEIQEPSTEPFDGEISSMNQVPIPPCLAKAIKHENPKHEIRVALALYLADNLRWFSSPDNFNAEETRQIGEEITDYISTLGWRDYNRQTTKSQVMSLLKYARTPSANWFKARNLCNDSCWLHGTGE